MAKTVTPREGKPVRLFLTPGDVECIAELARRTGITTQAGILRFALARAVRAERQADGEATQTRPAS